MRAHPAERDERAASKNLGLVGPNFDPAKRGSLQNKFLIGFTSTFFPTKF